MTVEFLYPELCNLYGDRGNMDYLRRCLPAEYRETAMGAEPWFVRHDVDLIYLCSMTERSQQRVIDALRPHKARLAELMQQGTHFLLTGNAMEVFGKTIQDGETAIEGLGLLDLTARRILPKRANSLFLGDFEGKKIVGYTSRFSHMESSLPPLFTAIKGLGRSEGAAAEGVRSGGVVRLAGVERVIAVRVQPVHAEHLRVVQPSDVGLHAYSFPARAGGLLLPFFVHYTRCARCV